jgi:hypothetical protein
MADLREKNDELARMVISRLARGLRAYGSKNKENHGREIRIREACGLKSWSDYLRWLRCDQRKRGPAFAAFFLFAAAVHREMPKKDAEELYEMAFKFMP